MSSNPCAVFMIGLPVFMIGSDVYCVRLLRCPSGLLHQPEPDTGRLDRREVHAVVGRQLHNQSRYCLRRSDNLALTVAAFNVLRAFAYSAISTEKYHPLRPLSVQSSFLLRCNVRRRLLPAQFFCSGRRAVVGGVKSSRV